MDFLALSSAIYVHNSSGKKRKMPPEPTSNDGGGNERNEKTKLSFLGR